MRSRDRPKPGGTHAAWRNGRRAHRSAVVWSLLKVPLTTAVRTLSIRCAPLGDQRICWLALIRRCSSRCTVLSVAAVQGNRISKQGQELGEICVVPSGAFEFAAQGSFGAILLHHVQRQVSQHREVVWPVVQSAPVLILVHYDIEPPV